MKIPFDGLRSCAKWWAPWSISWRRSEMSRRLKDPIECRVLSLPNRQTMIYCCLGVLCFQVQVGKLLLNRNTTETDTEFSWYGVAEPGCQVYSEQRRLELQAPALTWLKLLGVSSRGAQPINEKAQVSSIIINYHWLKLQEFQDFFLHV